jgi:hypothetical protein
LENKTIVSFSLDNLLQTDNHRNHCTTPFEPAISAESFSGQIQGAFLPLLRVIS